MLSAQGMSTRAIAPTVGAGVMTVSDDRKALRAAGVRTPYTSEPESLDEYRGRVLADAEANHKVIKLTGPESVSDPAPAKVVGLDGKTYTRPEPKPQADRRTPLRDGFRDAALDLDKLVHRFERLAADDRLPRNRSEVARYANDLTRATDALQRVAEQLSN